MPMMVFRLSKQRGVTLIEVMIALLILAIGLLGFAAMQTQGMVTGRKAFLNSQAEVLAEDMVERIRANSLNAAGVAAYAMTTNDNGVNKGCDTNNCSISDMRQWDQFKWKTRLANTLPSGNGDVTVTIGANGYATVKITVSYALDREETANAQYMLATQINPT